ncbi:polysaccharide deacetylase family protein [Fervidobacterium gondwanense]|uniref:polysaccharide deacetylase family protein n=1 Tax=Fervidobacterium gondwanense TaxID=44754 RepID=UPI003C75873D
MKRIVYAIAQKTLEFLENLMPNYGYILMFHEIKEELQFCQDLRYCISMSSFEKMISELEENQTRFCAISEVLQSKKPANVFITFDDGYEDIYSTAYPILKKKRIPFTVFITTEFIGKDGYLTLQMLKELAQEPLCTIGAHSVSHPRLRECNKKQLVDEIHGSKYYIETFTNQTVSIFAYPYGSVYACSLESIRETKNAGYMLAFSTLNAHMNPLPNHLRYFIPRISVNESNYKSITKLIIESTDEDVTKEKRMGNPSLD